MQRLPMGGAEPSRKRLDFCVGPRNHRVSEDITEVQGFLVMQSLAPDPF